MRGGTLPVSVVEVVKGEPAPEKIAIEVSLPTSCDYPGQPGRGRYIVGRFWTDEDGKIDRSPKGLPIFSPILYRQHFFRTAEEERTTALEYEKLAAEIEAELIQIRQQRQLKLITLAGGGLFLGLVLIWLIIVARRTNMK